MLCDSGFGFGSVGVDEPELDAAGCELLGEAGEFGGVAVGDGAICADKDENAGGGGFGERVWGGGKSKGRCYENGQADGPHMCSG